MERRQSVSSEVGGDRYEIPTPPVSTRWPSYNNEVAWPENEYPSVDYGSYSSEPSYATEESSRPQSAIDPHTGTYYPGVEGGVINPRDSLLMPKVGPNQYFDVRTGEFLRLEGSE